MSPTSRHCSGIVAFRRQEIRDILRTQSLFSQLFVLVPYWRLVGAPILAHARHPNAVSEQRHSAPSDANHLPWSFEEPSYLLSHRPLNSKG